MQPPLVVPFTVVPFTVVPFTVVPFTVEPPHLVVPASVEEPTNLSVGSCNMGCSMPRTWTSSNTCPRANTHHNRGVTTSGTSCLPEGMLHDARGRESTQRGHVRARSRHTRMAICHTEV